MTRFTIFGATGFIGSHLARYLQAEGGELLVPGRDEALPNGDLGHVFYCIGMTADYLDQPVATTRAHVCILADILDKTSFKSLTYLSSTRLYDSGGADAVETNDLILNPATPRHLFDLTKGAGEALCLAAGHRGVRVARLSSVYGDDLGSDNFVHQIIRRASLHSRLELDSGAGFERDYIHVDDVCTALHRIAMSGRRPIYNVASGINVPNRDLFGWIERETGCRIKANGPAARVASPRINIDALSDDFGFTPAPLSQRISGLVRASATAAEPTS